MTKATGKMNPAWKLSPDDRVHVGVLDMLGLWPKRAIAAAFGISHKTVYQHSSTLRKIEEEEGGKIKLWRLDRVSLSSPGCSTASSTTPTRSTGSETSASATPSC